MSLASVKEIAAIHEITDPWLRIRSYSPARENRTVVTGAFGVPKVTLPGPLSAFHVTRAARSLTVPARIAGSGKTTTRTGPAVTRGANRGDFPES